MRPADAVRLVALAAIWGASFLFMRIAAPAIGPFATAEGRMLIASVTLGAYYAFIGFDVQWRRWWRYYLVIGLINSAAPFLLYAYSALSLSVGLIAVVNATSPMWGALLSAIILRERLSARRGAGLVLGIAGVALVSGSQAATAWLAIAACLGGAFCYGLAGVVLRKWGRDTTARGMAMGTQMMAGLALLPLLLVAPPGVPSPAVMASLLALGVLSSGVAYVMYFRLIADIGATRALTVTYLMPV